VRAPAHEQVEAYRRDGFVLVEDFLDADELERWRIVTADAVAERQAVAAPVGDAYYQRIFAQLQRLADTYEPMAELILDERLGEIAATLAGVDGLRVWHDQALIKPPYGNPTAWHLDNPFWSFSSRDAISIWIALDDATIQNGCLWYLPGTHRSARFELVEVGPSFGALFDEYPEWLELEAVATACRAGGAVFHNGLTAHAAGANVTSRPRRAMTCAYMPDGCTFNGVQNVLPDDYFAELSIGEVLDDESINPLVWSRSRPRTPSA
jgi:ectoine hydroxylase-related dioxygenase (phytanoyl-CoA dioxygenase family)